MRRGRPNNRRLLSMPPTLRCMPAENCAPTPFGGAGLSPALHPAAADGTPLLGGGRALPAPTASPGKRRGVCSLGIHSGKDDLLEGDERHQLATWMLVSLRHRPYRELSVSLCSKQADMQRWHYLQESREQEPCTECTRGVISPSCSLCIPLWGSCVADDDSWQGSPG